eukprot:2522044-Amphidinium_carterae.1
MAWSYIDQMSLLQSIYRYRLFSPCCSFKVRAVAVKCWTCSVRSLRARVRQAGPGRTEADCSVMQFCPLISAVNIVLIHCFPWLNGDSGLREDSSKISAVRDSDFEVSCSQIRKLALIDPNADMSTLVNLKVNTRMH